MDIIKFVELNAISPLNQKPVKLMDWQKDFLSKMINKDSSVNMQNCCLWGAKKTSKSFLIGCILFYLLFYRKNSLSVCMSANEAQSMVIKDSIIESFGESVLFKELKVLKNQLIHEKNKTEIRVLNRSTNCNGLRVSNLAIDELFSFDDKNFEQLSILENSLKLQNKPMRLVCSNVPSDESHKSISMLDSWKRQPKKWVVKSFCADKRLKPDSVKAWKQANPFLKNKDFKKTVMENYKNDWKEAKLDHRARVNFYRFSLGWPAQLRSDSFLDANKFNWSPELIDDIFNDERMQFVLGIDLATKGSDATALQLCAWQPLEDDEDPIQDQELFCLPKIYYGNIKNTTPHIQKKIRQWANSGDVIYQNKDVIDQREVLNDLYALLDKFPVVKENLTVSIDPAFSQPWVNELNENGFNVRKRFFSPRYTTPGIRRTQRICEAGKLHFLTKENEAIKFQSNSCVTNEQSKNYTSLKRLNNNNMLTIDSMAALVLAVSELVEDRPTQDCLAL